MDIEANEDEDTNESSRLLVRTVRNNRSSPNNEALSNQNEEAESLTSHHRNLSNPNLTEHGHARANANGSLNNQIMTTSGSNQVATGAESQLKQSSSRYGSICSVNSLTKATGETAGASVLRGENDGDDDDDEYEKQLKSNNHVILINEAKRKKPTSEGGKETPEFFTPQSVTSESSAAISSSSFTPVQTDKELKLKTYTNKKGKKSKSAATAAAKNKNEQPKNVATTSTISEAPARTSSNSKQTLSKRKKSNKVDAIPKDYDEQQSSSQTTETAATSSANTPPSPPSNEPDSCTKINFAYDRQNDDDDDDGPIDA